MDTWKLKTAAAGTAMALALTMTALTGCGNTASANKPPATTPPAAPIEMPTPVATENAVPILTPPVPTLPPFEAPPEPEETAWLLNIPLDPEVQAAIFGMCGGNESRFCFLMAIASHESDFDPSTVGDGGRSLGIMQINTKWHTARADRLGVADLKDPAGCALVALDILQELADRYGFEPESHEMCMAFNMGPGGARKALAAGKTATDYSRAVMAVYQEYLQELEG